MQPDTPSGGRRESHLPSRIVTRRSGPWGGGDLPRGRTPRSPVTTALDRLPSYSCTVSFGFTTIGRGAAALPTMRTE
jgi:hypothetical protein